MHDRHLIFSTKQNEDNDIAGTHLFTTLKRLSPERSIEFIYLDIQDPIYHREIQGKIHPILASLKDDDIDIRFPRDTYYASCFVFGTHEPEPD